MRRSTSNYPTALRHSAVRRVFEATPLHSSQWSTIEAVATEFEIGSPETLRRWVRRAEITAGHRSGVEQGDTSQGDASQGDAARGDPARGDAARGDAARGDADELVRLRRQVAELQRSNAILQATSTFFAAELDRPHPRS